jgi:hypothetical protein
MNFVELVDAHGRTMHKDQPPILVAHPIYGELGACVPNKGLVPPKNRWASTKAILRDSDRRTIQMLRRFEDHAPKFVFSALMALLAREPMAMPYVLGAISTYDGIVTARGSGALQDVWMAMTATQTPVTLSWYDLMSFANWVPMTAPSITAYTNGGTGGAVLDASSNGSWLTNPAGTNKKYIISMGLTINSLTGFALAMLYDCLWAGQYVITSNTTINPTSDIAVTRWANTSPSSADYAGGNQMMCSLGSTLTHSGAPTITTSYVDQGGAAGSTISVAPATGLLINRILFNTIHNAATVISSTPFMPLTNSGDSGVTSLSQVVISGGTSVTAGTINHKIVRPLIIMPFIAANSYIEQDTTLNIGNMVELHNASQVCGCLGWAAFSAGTTAASISAFMRTVEG